MGKEEFTKSRDVISPRGSWTYSFTEGKEEDLAKDTQKLPGSAQEPNGQRATLQLPFSIKGKSLTPRTHRGSRGVIEQIPSSAKACGVRFASFPSAGVSQQPLQRSASTMS